MRHVDARLAPLPASDQRRASLDLASHHADGDAAEARRGRRAANVADALSSGIEQLRARHWRLRARGAQSTQMLVHVTAKMHARNGLLSRVATLGVRDGVELLEVRLLRQCRFIDVDPPFGAPRFDASNLPCVESSGRRLRGERPFPQHLVDLRGREELEALELEIRNPRNHDPCSFDLYAYVRVRR